MKIGYVVRGSRLYGKPWESEMFEDAEDCDQTYHDIVDDRDYSELKRYTAYINYEEWRIKD